MKVRGETVRPMQIQDKDEGEVLGWCELCGVEEDELAPKGVSKNEGAMEDESEELENVKPKKVNVQERPSTEEVEEHNLTGHAVFRSWCPHCVSGRAVSNPHLRRDEKEDEEAVPMVSVDYMFMHDNKDPELGRKGKEDEDGGMPIMVVKDRKQGLIQASVVPCKGLDGYAVHRLGRNIESFGHKKIVLKSDNEPAIVKLKRAVKAERSEDIVLEEMAAYDSRGNGEIENAVGKVQGSFRSIKGGLESRYKK